MKTTEPSDKKDNDIFNEMINLAANFEYPVGI